MGNLRIIVELQSSEEGTHGKTKESLLKTIREYKIVWIIFTGFSLSEIGTVPSHWTDSDKSFGHRRERNY